MKHPSELVLVLNFGAQYAQLIARKIRECQVYCELAPADISPAEIRERGASALVLSGGPSSVYAPGAPQLNRDLLDLGLPILGICYGHQALVQAAGGEVESTQLREYGKTQLRIMQADTLFAGQPQEQVCWMSHGDSVTAVPNDFLVLARTDNTPVAAYAAPERKLYGVQFHPEVVHTPHGVDMLRNFLYRACGLRGTWTMESIVERAVADIRDTVGDGRVLCGLSGGVDSAVTAALVHRAVGDRLTCLFVNHGFLRKGEADEVRQTFTEHFGIDLVYVDASERFLQRLSGVVDPEEKRQRIGAEFIRIFEEQAGKLGDVRFLAQGTLYSDVIESGGASHAATIKSHHNVGGLPERMDLELIEPLRDLFKDEARQLGLELGLPENLVWRHPFPGPGLAIRIIGEVTRERLETLREADAIIIEEIRRAGLYRELFQAFAVLPAAVQTVGVMGDQRTYQSPVVCRAVTSDDVMTADWARLPDSLLERMANRVVNEVPGVNRLLYDLTSKPPGTIEWE